MRQISVISIIFATYTSLTTPLALARYESQINSALDFLEHYQTTGKDGYEEGQWRAKVTTYVPSHIGVGKFGVAFDEPSAFVAASVGVVLGEIHRLDSRHNRLPALTARATLSLAPFKWGDLFNFYPPSTFKGVPVRAPRYMYLAPQWRGFANIPPDSDTTAVTYTLLYHQDPQRKLELPARVLQKLSFTRDLRRKPHPYNAAQLQINTGAFMTWLWDEKDPKMPRNIFAAPHRGTRIPFNINDVDCVVNSNVLKMLTYAGKTEGPGYRSSCQYLNNVTAQKQFYFCGMYYPSNYALPYGIASALSAGATCLGPSQERLVNYLISKQHRDGSWKNSILARPDRIQSTAWALNALMLLGDTENQMHRQRVQRGLTYLLNQAQQDSDGRTYWPGQVFFAATFVARYPVVWRSTAYTTALATKALVLGNTKWR